MDIEELLREAGGEDVLADLTLRESLQQAWVELRGAANAMAGELDAVEGVRLRRLMADSFGEWVRSMAAGRLPSGASMQRIQSRATESVGRGLTTVGHNLGDIAPGLRTAGRAGQLVRLFQGGPGAVIEDQYRIYADLARGRAGAGRPEVRAERRLEQRAYEQTRNRMARAIGMASNAMLNTLFGTQFGLPEQQTGLVPIGGDTPRRVANVFSDDAIREFLGIVNNRLEQRGYRTLAAALQIRAQAAAGGAVDVNVGGYRFTLGADSRIHFTPEAGVEVMAGLRPTAGMAPMTQGDFSNYERDYGSSLGDGQYALFQADGFISHYATVAGGNILNSSGIASGGVKFLFDKNGIRFATGESGQSAMNSVGIGDALGAIARIPMGQALSRPHGVGGGVDPTSTVIRAAEFQTTTQLNVAADKAMQQDAANDGRDSTFVKARLGTSAEAYNQMLVNVINVRDPLEDVDPAKAKPVTGPRYQEGRDDAGIRPRHRKNNPYVVGLLSNTARKRLPRAKGRKGTQFVF